MRASRGQKEKLMKTRNRSALMAAFLTSAAVLFACKKAEPPAPPPEPTAAPTAVPTPAPAVTLPADPACEN